MILRLLTIVLSCSLLSCQEVTDVTYPEMGWEAFASAPMQLNAGKGKFMEGVYRVEDGKDFFGPFAVGKWSYTITGNDTAWHFSIFTENEASVMVTEGRMDSSTILLHGFWRKMVNTEVGALRLTLTGDRSAPVINGFYGKGEDSTDQKVSLRWMKGLEPVRPLLIIAHRGGGRNNDLLPASENSIEMIKLAARLGATGMEIDVKLSKDGVPVLYHDDRINDRLTQKAGIRGMIKDHSLSELNAIELKRGGKIPTLAQALDTILYKTPIEFLWLDCKYDRPLDVIRELQQLYTRKAAAAGRKLEILIGIPDETMMEHFVKLPGFRSIPSLTEMDTAMASKMGMTAWAPGWTDGLQNETVGRLQQQGRAVYVWTVDLHAKIQQFVKEGRFNGIVSNRPGMVSYYYYTGF